MKKTRNVKIKTISWEGVYRIKAKEKGKKLNIRSNAKQKRQKRTFAVFGEEGE